MVKHNNIVPNQHFHKKWQVSSRGPLKVKLNLDQPAQKKARRLARAEKAAAIAPAPLQKLRPAVHCPTQRYNAKVRLGRGFTLAELKAAGINKVYARTVGIAVDTRRQNKSEESMVENVARLAAYTAKLVVFPKKKNATAVAAAAPAAAGTIMPLVKAAKVVVMEAVPAAGKETQYTTMRKARGEPRIMGQQIAAKNRKEKE